MPTIELSAYYVEFIGFLLTLIVGLSIRDAATSFVKGAKFRFNPAFKEGDKVILDGNPALIVKIGLSETVFGVYGEEGYTWRYVPNTRIEFLKLEKIVDPDLHRDTDQERAQKLVDAMQDAKIKTNGEEISKLKNGEK
mgnify:FL=1|jgi:hypothetical protein|tara:strand:- start:1318 stop:1731 length:414 start_codon:yes stop_codon:yes gene_type:complete